MTHDDFMTHLIEYASRLMVEHGKILPTIATLDKTGVRFAIMTGLPEYRKARSLMHTLGAVTALDNDHALQGIGIVTRALMADIDKASEQVEVLNITIRCEPNRPDNHLIFQIQRRGSLLDLQPVEVSGVVSHMSSLLDAFGEGYRAAHNNLKNDSNRKGLLS